MSGCCLVIPCPAPPLLQRLLAHTSTISRKQRRSLHAYYLRQNELIDALLQTEQIHRGLYTNDAHRVRSWGGVQMTWRWGGLQPGIRRPQRQREARLSQQMMGHTQQAGPPTLPPHCHLAPTTPQEEAQVRRALVVSFIANCMLLVVRTALALLSGSLSLVIATLDAVLDVLSSIMLYWSAHQAKQRNKCELNGRGQVVCKGFSGPPGRHCCTLMHTACTVPTSGGPTFLPLTCCQLPSPPLFVADQYPVGKERMEPLGIIVFSVIMGTAAFQVIVEGVKARWNCWKGLEAARCAACCAARHAISRRVPCGERPSCSAGAAQRCGARPGRQDGHCGGR